MLDCLRAVLALASLPYGACVLLRNRGYDARRRQVVHADVPVISVGNITAGGAGKTPLAAWLAMLLKRHGRRPAILSRGYGRDARTGLDDENRMLASLAPSVPVAVNPDRAAGAAEAVGVRGANVLVLDDGFQHRRLARDLDIVLIDALAPFGIPLGSGGTDDAVDALDGRLLPRGLLREPLGSLARAGVIVITRSDLVAREFIEQIKSEVARHAPSAPVVLAVHQPVALRPVGAGGDEQALPPETLREGRWAAFCGIGNPDGFRGTLAGLGADVARFRAFPDHHRYSQRGLSDFLSEAGGSGLKGAVTTEKDAVKVARALPPSPALPVFALAVRMELVEGGEALKRRVLESLGE